MKKIYILLLIIYSTLLLFSNDDKIKIIPKIGFTGSEVNFVFQDSKNKNYGNFLFSVNNFEMKYTNNLNQDLNYNEINSQMMNLGYIYLNYIQSLRNIIFSSIFTPTFIGGGIGILFFGLYFKDIYGENNLTSSVLQNLLIVTSGIVFCGSLFTLIHLIVDIINAVNFKKNYDKNNEVILGNLNNKKLGFETSRIKFSFDLRIY